LTDKYSRQELYPLTETMDADEPWPDGLFKKLGGDGYLGIAIPEQYGGAGADLFTSGLVLQAMSRWNHAAALSWVAHDKSLHQHLYRNGGQRADPADGRRLKPGRRKTVSGCLLEEQPRIESHLLG
jgi:isovaleryl-CoA dehydrogenase